MAISTGGGVAADDRALGSEDQVRIDLAACYRLVALFGWDDLVFTHISAKLPGPGHRFLINPYGLTFDEVTASNLVEVDLDGHALAAETAAVNPAGFLIHSAVHQVRSDAACVLHLHTNAGVAVSAQRDGLLPISQQSLFALGSLAYHRYEGLALNDDERSRLQDDLGQASFMILRNHGLLTVGRTVADAFIFMYVLQRACEIQLLAQSGNPALDLIAGEVVEQIEAQTAQVTRGLGGAVAWPALLRRLDRLDPAYRS